jgi:hypothetical protein
MCTYSKQESIGTAAAWFALGHIHSSRTYIYTHKYTCTIGRPLLDLPLDIYTAYTYIHTHIYRHTRTFKGCCLICPRMNTHSSRLHTYTNWNCFLICWQTLTYNPRIYIYIYIYIYSYIHTYIHRLKLLQDLHTRTTSFRRFQMVTRYMHTYIHTYIHMRMWWIETFPHVHEHIHAYIRTYVHVRM